MNSLDETVVVMCSFYTQSDTYFTFSYLNLTHFTFISSLDLKLTMVLLYTQMSTHSNTVIHCYVPSGFP